MTNALSSPSPASAPWVSLLLLLWAGALARPLRAQVSLTSAVDLALRNSPRVKMAEADVAKARAAVAETKDVYIPSVVGQSSGLGYSYGFPLGTPTIFSFSAQSLVFSYSQRDYIRAATSGFSASVFALKEVRQQIAEDTVLTYLLLDKEQRQRAALQQEATFATHLEDIVKDRLDAGQDTAMEYTRARRNVVQLRLQMLQNEDDLASSEDHLARLTGLLGTTVHTVPESIPAIPPVASPAATRDTFGVQSAFANARARREQAFGDARYLLRPQLSFGAQYSRFSTYNNNYTTYYPGIANQLNAFGLAVDVSVPIFDAGHRAKARETAADALHLEHEAALARDQAQEGSLKLQHSMAELAARASLASLDRDLAQQQLEVVLLQLQAPNPSATSPAITPKDEQNARLQERQRFLELLDAEYQLRQSQVGLLRQNGQLESWLKSAAAAQTLAPVPSP